MRSVILRSLAVTAIGGVVLVGLLYLASTVDARAPEVLEIGLTQPVPGEPDVALVTTSVEVVFSEPVDPASAVRGLTLRPAVDGAVSWSGSTMIFTPSEPLDLETPYAVVIAAGIRDQAGNEMTEPPPEFAFRTAGRPSVVATDPPHGADQVPLEAPITMTFSRLMDTASVESALAVSPAFAHELRWSGELLELVPTEPLRPGVEYELTVGEEAADVAGIALDEPIMVTFETVAAGLGIEQVVPADGIDGVAPTSPIAVFFDRPVDPESVADRLLTVTPDIPGSLELIGTDEEPTADGGGTLLRFTPSGPMPANTTFEVTVATGITGVDGGGLAREASWTFTTGAPVAVVSNQITFVTALSGVPNVWAMNPDGTGRRQLSVELSPVLDYAVAPDGSSLVVGDGRRLVFLRADGSGRRVLTDEAAVEFDPAFAPDAQRLAFARADAETGEPLGIFEWEIGAAAPELLELPEEPDGEPEATDEQEEPRPLRAPRWSPDGELLAFVDLTGSIGVLDLEADELLRVEYTASDAPAWLPDGRSLLVTGAEDRDVPRLTIRAPVEPLRPGPDDDVVRLVLSRESLSATPFVPGSSVLAIAADGAIAHIDGRGALYLTELPNTASGEAVVDDTRVLAAAFAPGEATLVIETATDGGGSAVELLDPESGRRTLLVEEGSRPRWLP